MYKVISSNTLAVIRFHDISFEMYTRTDISTVLPHDIKRKTRENREERRKMAILEHATRRVFFSPHARPIFRPSERILSLPLLLLFPPPPPPPGTLPPRVSLWHGYRQMGPPFCARIVTPSTRPPSDARASKRERERESESTARCVTMPGHSWHCYRYCYYYRYCCRLRPSGEWESRGPMSQLLRRVLH